VKTCLKGPGPKVTSSGLKKLVEVGRREDVLEGRAMLEPG